MKTTIWVSLIFLMATSLTAQPRRVGQERIDSLLIELKRSKNGMERWNILFGLGDTYADLDPLQGLKCGFELLDLASELPEPKYQGDAHWVISSNYRSHGDLVKAYEHALKAEARYGSELRKEHSRLHLLMAAILFDIGDMEQALQHSSKAVQVARKMDPGYLLRALVNHADHKIINGELYPAEQILAEVIELSTAQDRPDFKMEALLSLAQIKLQESRFDEAEQLLHESRILDDSIRNPSYMYLIDGNLGFICHQRSELALEPKEKNALLHKAFDHYHASFTKSKGVNRSNNLLNMSEMSEKLGKFEEALAYMKWSYAYKDSLAMDEQRAGVDELQRNLQDEIKQLELVQKQHELDRTQMQRLQLMGLLGLALISLIALAAQIRRTHVARIRSDHLLHNILPAHTAEELKTTGTTEPRHYDNVTILFTDFKDYTRVVGSLTAKETVKLIDHYFSRFDEIVKEHALEKIKTIGDAYMCVSGIPDEKPDHAIRAARAAKEMLAFVKEEEAKRSAAGEPWFQIRIGLHTGPVVAGVVGRTKFAYDVWGDTVNVAARLEQHGEAGRINISRTTFEYVKHRFPCTPKGYITVKHGVELELYQVEEVGELVV